MAVVIAEWLCSLNRHKLAWRPDPPPGRRVEGQGIPPRSYMVPRSLDYAGPAGRLTVTSSGTTFEIAQQESYCRRCEIPLAVRAFPERGSASEPREPRKRVLGWERGQVAWPI